MRLLVAVILASSFTNTLWAQQSEQSTQVAPAPREATTVAEWVDGLTSDRPNYVAIGFEYGVGTLQMSGADIEYLTSEGDFAEENLAGLRVELPTSTNFAFITGLRREKLQWDHGPNAFISERRFENEYTGAPLAFRGYFGSSIVRPYVQAGILLAKLTKATHKDSFHSLSVRGEIELGVGVAVTKTVQFGIGVRGTSSLQDELKAVDGAQKINGIAGASSISALF